MIVRDMIVSGMLHYTASRNKIKRLVETDVYKIIALFVLLKRNAINR